MARHSIGIQNPGRFFCIAVAAALAILLAPAPSAQAPQPPAPAVELAAAPSIASMADQEARLRQLEIGQARWSGVFWTLAVLLPILAVVLAWLVARTWRDAREELAASVDRARADIHQAKMIAIDSLRRQLEAADSAPAAAPPNPFVRPAISGTTEVPEPASPRAIDPLPTPAEARDTRDASAAGRIVAAEAETVHHKGLEPAPKSSDYHHNRGLLLARSGRRTEAESAYRHAIELDPNLVSAHFNLACLFAGAGEKTNALTSLGRAIALDPQYRDKARADKDFDPLRNDPDFVRLVEPDDSPAPSALPLPRSTPTQPSAPNPPARSRPVALPKDPTINSSKVSSRAPSPGRRVRKVPPA